MDMEMMMYHQELYRLHCELSRQHYEMSKTQAEIANLNYKIYMHMMDQMNGDNHNSSKYRSY